MDIYRFIGSRDIREHLKNIGYEFNSFECAYLVWLSGQSIEEKHNAYNEIIETMPDMTLTENMLRNADKNYTLHTYLVRLMEIENRLIDEIRKPSGFYGYSVWWNGDWVDSKECFAEFEHCIDDFRETYNEDGIRTVRIEKTRPLAKGEEDAPELDILYSLDEGVIQISESHILNETERDLLKLFEEVWLEIPTPFKKGDLLYEPALSQLYQTEERPFVITNLCTWESAERKAKWKKQHCFLGMTAHGYYLTYDGQIEYDEMIINYLNLEYYRGELKDKKRFLKALSNFVKGEIDICLLLHAYEVILREADLNAAKAYLGLYTDESLELAALGKEYKER